jgi:hypothetical protein
MTSRPLTRSQESLLTAVIAALLLVIVGTALTALTGAGSGARRTALLKTAPVGAVLNGADFVSPIPIALSFATPLPASRPSSLRPRATVRPVQLQVRRPARPSALAGALCTGDGWQARRGQAALASLLHPIPDGVTLSFLPGGGALKGMTYYDTHHVDVYVGGCGVESDGLLRHVVAHEMGHAWDSLHMTDALRADYLAARGIPAGTPWLGCNGCQDFATPAGDFAETFAQWQRGTSDSRSRMAPPAQAAQLADLGARFFS